MNYRIYIIICVFISLTLRGFTQHDQKFKEKFISASYFYLYEEYEKALPIYLELYDKDPSNANINFKIGNCYLQIPGQSSKAVPFLEYAVTNISPKHNEFSYKETTAPEVAYYRLGEAYHQNIEFDKALSSYKRFKLYLRPKDIYNNDIVNKQIETCNNAKELYRYPVIVVKKNLGNLIKTPFYDFNPVVSGDQQTLIFTSERKLSQTEMDSIAFAGIIAEEYIQEVFYSKKINDEWQKPINITNDLGSNGFCNSVYLSEDGTHLLLMKDDYYDGNIYESKFIDGKWSKIKKLSKSINSKAWEGHACLTKDGNTIYFSSDRKGGYGGFDIYKAEKNDKGEWGNAINLGPTVNTKFDDDTPFILGDDKTLYFSSEGHYNMGGFDIFYTYQIEKDKWTLPLNLGYPINTPEDNLFMYPVSNGEFTYFADAKLDGSAGTDIYMMKLIVPENPGEFDVNGVVRVYETKQKPKTLVTINLIDTTTNKITYTHFTNIENGEFSFTTIPGVYKIEYSAKGYLTKTDYLHVPRILYRKEFYLIVDLVPDGLIATQDLIVSNENSNQKGKYISVKDINFTSEDNNIDHDSKVELEKLSILLKTNPDLTVEIESYSSSNISKGYDIKLAEKKQNDIINYLAENGIDKNRFSFKQQDITNDLALNSIELKVLKQTNDSLIADNDIFLPEKIKNKDQLTYTILLAKNSDKLNDNYFNNYNLANIDVYNVDNKFTYTSGNFANQYEAVKYLNNIIESGYADAKIIDNFELKDITKSSDLIASNNIKNSQTTNNQNQNNNSNNNISSNNNQVKTGNIVFTIQIGAYSESVNLENFNSLKGVTEHKGTDNKYRYIYGRFNSYTLAKQEWMRLNKLGYSDAFIMNIERYKE